MSNSISEISSNSLLHEGENTTDTLTVSDNIIYSKASHPEAEGMTLKIGPNGTTSLYKAPTSDSIQSDTENTDILLTETFQEIFTITTTEELTSVDTTFGITGDFANSSSRSKVLTVQVKIDTVSLGDIDYTLWAGSGSDHQQLNVSKAITTTYPVGTVISIEMKASDENRITLNGTYQIAKLVITKAPTLVTASEIIPKGGDTATRPVDPALYTTYWDTDLNTIVTCTNNITSDNKWTNTVGTEV